jgi:hypothetical protein
MATSFGALCSDFFIDQTLAVKMDLPGDRETILHMFDRIRVDQASMERFRRYPDELVLESPRREGQSRWLALRAREIRSGVANPASLDDAYDLHRLVLRIAPYHLTLSPLDIEFLELNFAFDLECKANHNQVVQEALLAGTPLGRLLEIPGARASDVQPVVGMALSEEADLQGFVEVKTRTSRAEIRRGRFRKEPISVYLTVRRSGPVREVDELLSVFDQLRQWAERLANDQVVPLVLNPISRVIIGTA